MLYIAVPERTSPCAKFNLLVLPLRLDQHIHRPLDVRLVGN